MAACSSIPDVAYMAEFFCMALYLSSLCATWKSEVTVCCMEVLDACCCRCHFLGCTGGGAGAVAKMVVSPVTRCLASCLTWIFLLHLSASSLSRMPMTCCLELVSCPMLPLGMHAAMRCISAPRTRQSPHLLEAGTQCMPVGKSSAHQA